MWSIHTILHPTDFSVQSESALRLACSLAADYVAQLVLIHVVRTPIVLNDGMIMPDVASGADELRAKLERMRMPAEQVDVIRTVEEGNPTVEILHLAQLCRADLIVMGTHGRRGLGRWLMGSVAEEVVRKAPCPVLTVTAPAAEAMSPSPERERPAPLPVPPP